MPLQITSISPTSGPVGTVVQIFGNGFPTDPDDVGVMIGDVDCDNPDLISSSQINITVPDNAQAGFIVVETSTGASASSPVQFTVEGSDEPVEITSVSPKVVRTSQQVTIYGENLDEVTAIYFGTTRAMSVIHTGGSIRATVPSNARTGNVYIYAETKQGNRVQGPRISISSSVAIRVQHLALEELTEWEQAVTSAWDSLFESGSLPQALQKQFDSVHLPNQVSGTISKHQIDICSDSESSNVGAKHDCSFTSTNLTLNGVGAVTKGGEPIFSNDDDTVTFKLTYSNINIHATYNLHQECEICFIWCKDYGSIDVSDGFTYRLPAGTLQLTAAATTDPNTQKRTLQFTSANFSYIGGPIVIPDSAHDKWWEKIGSALSGWLITDSQIVNGLTSTTAQVLNSSQVQNTIIQMINENL